MLAELLVEKRQLQVVEVSDLRRPANNSLQRTPNRSAWITNFVVRASTPPSFIVRRRCQSVVITIGFADPTTGKEK
jgi:hypothetical protein